MRLHSDFVQPVGADFGSECPVGFGRRGCISAKFVHKVGSAGPEAKVPSPPCGRNVHQPVCTQNVAYAAIRNSS